ncbi:ABC transporter permease [Scatolibacter rhodanostii]|uniref:ABC transporter permease n=1 Tax=Scatolibacter rhodanostii TaxID=2014781 RepID=UPI000C08B4F3|nr:ABC-2 family transporter protein [Scatolibacter rhodanostii]
MKYLTIAGKIFKSQFSYTASTVMRLLVSLLTFFIQINLWSALTATGKSETTIEDMMIFVVINLIITTFTSANIANELEPAIRDGSVANYFIRPVSFKYHCFSENLGKNLYNVLTSALPVLILGFAVFKLPVPNISYFLLFLLSLLLGCLIMLELTYIFGLLAFFTQKTWYISWYLRAFTTLFGGTVVPLWFYPRGLNDFSYYLPFRYISFEPINLYLQKTQLQDVWIIISVSVFWILLLNLIGLCIYKVVEKRITINGG